MPKSGGNNQGGARPGSGRPKGVLNTRYQLTADGVADLGRDGYLPLEYMLALMRDERAEPTRRDQMAIQAAPYLHARLALVGTTPANGRLGGGDINIVQIFAVPRGAALDVKEGTVTIEGDPVTELPAVDPYNGTPALTDETAAAAPPPPEPLPVIELETGNVTRIDTFVKKDRE